MAEQTFPEPTVGALIINEKNEVFLVKSHKWNNKYTIPGGHVELGEKAEDALKREVKEETNMDISDVQYICWQEFIYDDAFWKKKHFIFLDYSCKALTTNVKLNEEGQDYVWVPVKDALQKDIDPYTRKTIEEYLKLQY